MGLIVDVAATHPLKLHLGCGERHITRYVNIDFPAHEHTVQQSSAADVCMDIRELSFPAMSVAEVRSHHVFEHFPRPVACALLACWVSWLIPGGRVRIETPDFVRSALDVVNPLLGARRRSVALRHIFGSNEAIWAVHMDGWSAGRLAEVMRMYGLSLHSVDRSRWKGTYNVDVVGEAKDPCPDRVALREATLSYLSRFVVDDSPGERRMLDQWMQQYDEQVGRGWASDQRAATPVPSSVQHPPGAHGVTKVDPGDVAGFDPSI